MALQQFPDKSKSFKTSDGTTYTYVSVAAENPSKATFLLLHGFPSSSYDWRHQIQSLTQLGHGVIAPDLLGYGGTDSPPELEKYKFKTQAGHVAEILREEGVAPVVGVSHDWGSGLLSRIYNYYPERLKGLVFLSVPYMEPGQFNLDAINGLTEQVFGYPVFGYWPFFNRDDAADICDKNNASLTSLLYPTTPDQHRENLCPYGAAEAWISSGKVSEPPSWFSEAEVAAHNKIIGDKGFSGPFNWYKVTIRGLNAEDEAAVPDDRKIVSLPTLFVNSDQDYITRAEVAGQIAQSGKLTDVKLEVVQGSGHWIQLEKKDELLEILKAFVEKL
ncbi:hypothetical protein DPSP01_004908 [Paraphaeosphaeria sporulosa]|uniref:Alpha/beta-hydrolase n=1 Tax=Paraphaeosphaeria sporulosa TaxID=1460663 RepID=A0A177C760_9PLEO|nr:alpha/beta-hydrolase [Paraphaeosphaeria sporulosa]OAG03246.1 alpha/beta-hydrolase [Paraphaeosphaeria sporulosa]